MRIRILVTIAGLMALAACGEPLGKKSMLAGCEAASAALRPDLASGSLDYRAVVGRESILRFHLQPDGAGPVTVNIKCKVNMRGALTRIKIDGTRARNGDLDAAKTAFAAATGR
ncbi:hypothetical protein [Emcibacter sp. SYSU 3D8]|uniref:hypothetical protein n=1 Tax=Emcibacter sp. SYSU 3D8 TaxID=3133969 RepID=UPI0031FE63F1